MFAALEITWTAMARGAAIGGSSGIGGEQVAFGQDDDVGPGREQLAVARHFGAEPFVDLLRILRVERTRKARAWCARHAGGTGAQDPSRDAPPR
jgi:hypothetical protein